MSDSKSKLSQILTLISKAKKENLVTDDEKRIIKEYIIDNKPDLTIEMEKYNKDKDLNSLVDSLKTHSAIRDMTSPMDNLIFQNKKKKQHKKKKAKKEEAAKEEEFDVEECDLGNSPVYIPTKFKSKK